MDSMTRRWATSTSQAKSPLLSSIFGLHIILNFASAPVFAADYERYAYDDLFSNDVGLDATQSTEVERIYAECKKQIAKLTTDEAQAKSRIKNNAARQKAVAKIQKQRDRLLKQRDSEIDKLLTEEQSHRIDDRVRWRKEGIPLGQNLFQSFPVREYFSPRATSGQFLSLEEAWRNRVQASLRPPDGVEFDLTNNGDVDYKRVVLSVAFMQNGKRVHLEQVAVADITANQTVAVVVKFREKFTDVKVKVANVDD